MPRKKTASPAPSPTTATPREIPDIDAASHHFTPNDLTPKRRAGTESRGPVRFVSNSEAGPMTIDRTAAPRGPRLRQIRQGG